MATIRWKGDAKAVAQVTTWTFGGTWEADDIITVTVGSKTVSVTAGSTTISTIIDSLVSAYNALSQSVYPEFAEMTASRSGSMFVLTADTAGRPFTITLATTEANGGAADSQTIGSATNSTSNSGPNDVSVAANYEGGSLPVDGDTLVIDQGSSSLLYNLDQSPVTLAAIIIGPNFTGNIGLPNINTDAGSSYPYYEYRERYLKHGASADSIATTITVNGGGGRIKISTNDSQATLIVKSTGNALEQNIPALLFKGTHSSNAITVQKGSVGVAFFEGETSTLATLNVGYLTNVNGDSQVVLGSGVTLSNATIKQSGGTLQTNSATSGSATITLTGGELTLNSGAQTGLSVQGGTCFYNSTGTLGGAPVVSGSGHLDFSQDLRSKAVTNPIEVYGAQAKISDPNKAVSSLVLDLNETANTDNLTIGRNIRLTRGTPS